MSKLLTRILLPLILMSFISACNLQRENVWYVATDGDDNNPCRSQARPCRTIQAAIEKVEPGSTIQIAAGVYFENIVINSEIQDEKKNLRFVGAGMESTEINGGGNNAVFTIIFD